MLLLWWWRCIATTLFILARVKVCEQMRKQSFYYIILYTCGVAPLFVKLGQRKREKSSRADILTLIVTRSLIEYLLFHYTYTPHVFVVKINIYTYTHCMLLNYIIIEFTKMFVRNSTQKKKIRTTNLVIWFSYFLHSTVWIRLNGICFYT